MNSLVKWMIGSGLLVCAAVAWMGIPSREYPDFEADLKSLSEVLGQKVLKECHVDVERRDLGSKYDQDEAAAMSFAEIATVLSLVCDKGRVNAVLHTYKMRSAAWWYSRGLTQCGENYCQNVWPRGRQTFIVNGPRQKGRAAGAMAKSVAGCSPACVSLRNEAAVSKAKVNP